MEALAPFALITATAALLVLPVLPALDELRKRRDATPLPTSRHDGRIANLAEAFQARIEPLRPQLEQCREKRELRKVTFDGMEVLLVGCEAFGFDSATMKGVSTILCTAGMVVPRSTVVDADAYAEGTLDLGKGSALRAAVSNGDTTLREESTILRWLHARGSAYLRRGSAVYGRLSANDSILLEQGCGFERMQAPIIFAVDGTDEAREEPYSSACPRIDRDFQTDSDGADLFEPSRPRLRIQGDFAVSAGDTLNANVIATGELHVGAGASVLGNTKSYKDTIVEADAQIHGSVVSQAGIRLGPRCYVAGPLLAETEVAIGRGSHIGRMDAPTTVSSLRIRIAAGCRLHGTAWARERGVVEG
ncbi:MAG: hypothetical protein WBS24_12745 [Terriglobales bacterium]